MQELNSYDPYIIMDVDNDASLSEIKNRFRKLTLEHHPDRNRRNPSYNPEIYKSICKAYAILIDPERRRNFDNYYSSTFTNLKEAGQKYISDQTRYQTINTEKNNKFNIKDKFTPNDLDKFNEMFEKLRAPDPSDHGYKYASRTKDMSISELTYKKLAEQVKIDRTPGINNKNLNEYFEKENKCERKNELMEHEDIYSNTIDFSGGCNHSDIAIYNGHMIVGKDEQDYTKFDMGSDTPGWVDYNKGFETISKQLPKTLKDKYTNAKNVAEQYEKRVSERTVNPFDEIPAGEQRSFEDAVTRMAQENKRRIEQERETKNKQLVLKYKAQYGDNYIESKPKSNPLACTPGQIFDIKRKVNIREKTDTNFTNNNIDMLDEHSRLFNQRTRETDDISNLINERLNKRNFML